MENLLDDNELNQLNESAKNVREEDFLSLGVYPMKVQKLEKKKDKNEDDYLSVFLDTGFTKMNSTDVRQFVKNFHLTGSFSDGKKKIELLAKFLKVCFGLKKITNEGLNGIIGRRLAVATRKDEQGYISYWYAGHINDLAYMRKKYNPKDTSGGNSNWDNEQFIEDNYILNPDE